MSDDTRNALKLALIKPLVSVSPSGKGLTISQTCLLCHEQVSLDTFARRNERMAKIVGMRHAVQAAAHLAEHGIMDPIS